MIVNKDNIRNLLIDSIHSNIEAEKFFERNVKNEKVLNLLVQCAIGDYSNDARMEAAYWISKFNKDILKTVENELLKIQKDELDSIACHVFLALGKIKSKEGLKYLIESRIKPTLYWEAQALKFYFENFLE